MLSAVKIDPDAVYDDSALQFELGISPTATKRGRTGGLLKYTKQGHRNLYLGRWVLEWLDSTAVQEGGKRNAS